MEQYRQKTTTYVSLCFKLNFFNSCKDSKIIPRGLVVEKNVATHVNDQLFIQDVMQTLNESSSRTFDKVIEKFEYSKVKLEEELEEAADDLGLVAAARVQIERETRDELSRLKIKLANKHLFQVQRVEESENAPFILSRGSRKVKGYKYIPPKFCNCNKRRIRPSKLRRRVKNRRYFVKFGPRRETMEDIIEADPMKEVLNLRATFGPRRETMKEIIEADTDPMKEVLRPG